MTKSDRLHQRVRAFIRATSTGARPPESFDAIACDIAREQVRRHTGLDRLFAARGRRPDQVTCAREIPAVPTDAFRYRRIACHPEHQDEARFLTSGTTLGVRGLHALRTVRTYRCAALSWAHVMLMPDTRQFHFIVVAPPYASTPESSLAFMLNLFCTQHGRSAMWVLREGELDMDALRRGVREAARAEQPVLLAGASYAFSHLLERLSGEHVPLPTHSRIMHTGGIKSRARVFDPTELRASLAACFELDPRFIVSEYGMTELSSQAYEATLREAVRRPGQRGSPGVHFPPPWMRVVAVDPVSLGPVARGKRGIARIVDLANVDSAVAIQTADWVELVGSGFRVLGRDPAAPPRGCSLGIEELLSPDRVPR